MKKFFSRLHLWLALPFGLVIIVIALTGATLVFEKEIREAAHPDLQRVAKAHKTPLPLDQILIMTKASIPDSIRIEAVEISPDPEKPYRVKVSSPRGAYVVMDQYTGLPMGLDTPLPFFNTARSIHRWLGNAPASRGDMTAGKMIVGISTIMFVIIILAGIVIWWPRKRVWHAMTIHRGNSAYGLWRSIHTTLGVWSTIFVLTLALTGLTWSFGWYRTGFYALWGGGAETAKTAPAKPTIDLNKVLSNPSPKVWSYWDRAYRLIYAKHPGSTITVEQGLVTVVEPHALPGDVCYVHFSPFTGFIEHRSGTKGPEGSALVSAWVKSIHTGTLFGIWSKIIIFLTALAAAAMPVTGYVMWLKRRRRA